jgi:hypothetical protein
MIGLQKFDFRESKYERPQDKWVCGHLAEGKPCTLGPGPNGTCRVTTVCQPRLENGRWECQRSAQEGGSCRSGPFPDGRCCQMLARCMPQPSLRTKRKRATLWATAFAIGLVAVILGGGAANQYLLPGQLSSFHASQTKCSTCHAGAGKMGWLHQFVASVGPEENSKLCIACHDMGAQPLAPHTHPVEALKQITESVRLRSMNGSVQADSWVRRIAFPGSPTNSASDGTVYCATCHEEHQGVSHDLTTVSNERCQTCHVVKFGSFADSHPQFSKYPYDRRTRIIFDHQSHLGKYLPEAAKTTTPGQVVPAGCADCHQLAVRQRRMEVKSFESMCSSCHNGDIVGMTRTSGPKGIDFLAVPGLDVATLTQRGVDIGDWPKNSEAILTPFMRFFLHSSGEKVVSGVAALDLLDLAKASDADLAKVAALAWSVKRLFNRLESVKLETAIGVSSHGSETDTDRLRTAALARAMLSHDVILEANREWFPNLQDDLLRHDKGEPTRTFRQSSTDAKSSALTLDMNSAVPNPGLAPSPDAKSSDDILAPAGDTAGVKQGPLAADDKDGLVAPDQADDTPPDALLGSENRDNSVKNGSDDSLLGGSDKSGKGDARSGRGQTNTAEAPRERFDPEAWAESGGWYRQDFAIRYRPSGHADRFLQTWLDFAGQATKQEDQLAPIFEQLASQEAIGRCTKCHSIDTDAGFKNINWSPFDRARVENRFTTFAHKPHVGVVGSEGCATCHHLNRSDGNYLKSYARGDPANYAPNFLYVEKAQCAACHTRQSSGEYCTLCHNYHVNELAPERASRRYLLRKPSWARSYLHRAGRPQR